jgi:hypothetical protein
MAILGTNPTPSANLILANRINWFVNYWLSQNGES